MKVVQSSHIPRSWFGIGSLLLTKVHILFRFSKFSPNVLFWSQDPTKTITFSGHVYLDAFWLCQFFWFPYFWWRWEFGGIPVRQFVECPSVGIRRMLFSWWDGGVTCFWEEDHRWRVPFSSHCVKGTHHLHNVSPCMLTLMARPK